MEKSIHCFALIASILGISLLLSCSSEDTTSSSDFVAPEIKVSVARLPRDPDNTPPLGGTFNDDWRLPPWINPGYNELFKTGNVAEILPVPKYLAHSDSLRIYYPASVGTLFEIATDMQDKINDILINCETGCKTKNGKPLANNIAEGITIYANVNYHPNAYRELFINCTNQIFQGRYPPPDPSRNNCLGNYNFYLAWALQYNNGKYVEAGTYVATTKFYWQIEYIDPNGTLKIQKFNSIEFKEKFTILEYANPKEPSM